MNLISLYLKDFLCFEESFVSFENFSYALITGSVENSKTMTNAIGKSVLFKAIEYVLFNECDFSLDKIIRDDQDSCRVGIDFELDGIFYRLIRSRNKRGNTDLTLLSLKDNSKNYKPIIINSQINRDGWEDISSRRTSDTEKHLSSLIKMNYSSFRGTVHFVQDDRSGLAQLTPVKRKAFLKEALSLSIFSKLEKIAKEKYSTVQKEIDKLSALIEYEKPSLPDELRYQELKDKLKSLSETQIALDERYISIQSELSKHKESFILRNAEVKSASTDLLNANKEKENITNQISSFTRKKEESLKSAKEISKNISELKLFLESNQETDLTELKNNLSDITTQLIDAGVQYSLILKEIEKLKIPLPENTVCEHCRSEISEEHLEKCKFEISNLLEQKKTEAISLKENAKVLKENKQNIEKLIEEKNLLNNKIKTTLSKIEDNSKMLQDRKEVYDQYTKEISSLKEKENILNDKIKVLQENLLPIESTKEYIDLKDFEVKHKSFMDSYGLNKKEVSNLKNELTMFEFQINQYKKSVEKLNSFKIKKENLEASSKAYPIVLQAFSSSGIPNFMIQNVLNDLQAEVNDILPQLHSGLSLSFVTEKSKKDSQEDTLDIVYHINGRERVFEQLSGAQKLAAIFSLKIGLMFLLQNISGASFNTLMLDEVDYPLDDASIDYFYELVKKLSLKFKVLVISHNSRFKEKMNNVIYIQQNYNKVSRIL